MVKRDPSLPTGFRIYQKLANNYGIYECDPIGVRHSEHNYPYWIIASLDLKKIKEIEEGDLVNVNFDLYYRQENYYTAMANDRLIIAVPQIEFKKIEFKKIYHDEYDEYDEDDEDEYEDFGKHAPRGDPILEEEKADVVIRIKELITAHEKAFNTPRRGHGIRQAVRNARSERSRSPTRGNLFPSQHYEESPIPPTIPQFKKNKKSLRKSKNKSKTSIKCKKTPYAWKSSSIKKSPFRTLKRAKDAESKYKDGQSIGFTAISSLKSLGRIPRSDGCYVLGAKYSALKGH